MYLVAYAMCGVTTTLENMFKRVSVGSVLPQYTSNPQRLIFPDRSASMNGGSSMNRCARRIDDYHAILHLRDLLCDVMPRVDEVKKNREWLGNIPIF